jgi:hypothetical protein
VSSSSDNLPANRGLESEARLALRQRQKKTKVYKHPDRETLEDLLLVWPANKVQRWLEDRYPLELDGEMYPEHRHFQINRKTLIEYRDTYLVEEGWKEPIDDSPLTQGDLMPMRVPQNKTMWELDVLSTVIQANEHLLAKSLLVDEEMGMVNDSTISLLNMLANHASKRAELAAKLGVSGYEFAAQKIEQRVDSHVQQETLQVNVDATPSKRADNPDTYELAKALLTPEVRDKLLGLEPMPEADIILEEEVVDVTLEEEAPTQPEKAEE